MKELVGQENQRKEEINMKNKEKYMFISFYSGSGT